MGIEHYCPHCTGLGLALANGVDAEPCKTCKGTGFVSAHKLKELKAKKDDGDETLEASREGSS